MTSCPYCGKPARANGSAWRCDYCQKRGTTKLLRQPRFPRLAGLGERQCRIIGCGRPLVVKELCRPHYRELRKRVPADRRKGLACYRGMPRIVIQELAGQKKADKQRTKERLFEARDLLFGRAGGRMMSLPREQRLFVNLDRAW